MRRLSASLVPAAFAVATLVALATPASAAMTYNQNLANGVYFGTGNPDGGWTVTSSNGIEVGLRTKVRLGAVITPVAGDGTTPGIYNAASGAPTGHPAYSSWNWEFSVDLNSANAANPTLHLSDYAANITITDLMTSSTIGYNALSIFPDNAKDGLPCNSTTSCPGTGSTLPADSAATRAQNSENMAWSGLSGFNPNNAHAYLFTLDLVPNSDANPALSVAMQVNAVPEPASMTLLGAGLAGLGAMRRRKRKQAVLS